MYTFDVNIFSENEFSEKLLAILQMTNLDLLFLEINEFFSWFIWK